MGAGQALIEVQTENGISRVQIPFHPDSLPTVETILSSVPEMNREDAEVLLEQVQAEFLDQCLDVNAVAGDASRDTVAMSRWFEERGIPQERIVAAFQRLEHRRATRGSPSQVSLFSQSFRISFSTGTYDYWLVIWTTSILQQYPTVRRPNQIMDFGGSVEHLEAQCLHALRC